MRKIYSLLLGLFLVSFPMFAFAQTTPDPDVGSLVMDGVKAVHQHDWRVLAATLLMVVVYVVRTYGKKVPKVGAFLATDRGGACLALLLSVCGGLGSALMSHAPFNFSMFIDSIIIAVTAAGGWNLAKKILAPSDKAAASAPPAA